MRKNATRVLKIGGLLLAPLALLALGLSFRFPETTEGVYSQEVYPQIVRLFAALDRASFSWAGGRSRRAQSSGRARSKNGQGGGRSDKPPSSPIMSSRSGEWDSRLA